MNYSYARGYSFDWGHIDVLRTIEWRGASYLRTEAILEGRRLSARGRPVPSVAHEASISWFTSLLWGAFFKARYASVIRQAVEVDGVVFRQALMHIAGKKWGLRLWQAAVEGRPQASAAWAHSLRSAVWWRACCRSPVRTVQGYFAFMIEELRRWWAPPAPWISILGMDGKAPSPLVNDIVSRFAQCPYGSVETFRWSPRLTADGDARGLRVAVDWMVTYWTQVAHLRAKGSILLLAGTHLDVVVDPREARPGRWFARTLWRLPPKPDLVFSLDLEADARLQDDGVSPSELAREVHVGQPPVRQPPRRYVLNGNLPPNVLLDDIERVIRAWMLVRSATNLDSVPAPINAARMGAPNGAASAPALLSRSDSAP